MTAYEKLKTARKNGRPIGSDYVDAMISERVELCGDRRFGEDSAILGGIGLLGDIPVTYIALDKGHDLSERMKKNFGCAKPEGYRKALRLMKEAEKFSRPVVCFVDTLGAFPGADGEERGQGQAIAESIMEMMGLRTPVISLIIGEGGSGGALALASASKVYMLENAVYSVITPEGCASILYKDAARVAEAAEALHITAADMLEHGAAEEIIPENFENFSAMCADIADHITEDIRQLSVLSADEIVQKRYDRFRRIGVYTEE